MSEKTVFISYRRDDVAKGHAQAISMALKHRGYDVFLDVNSPAPGEFDERIVREVARRAHFLLLLTPGALDRCADLHDWVRREYEEARQRRRNIVPVLVEPADLAEQRRGCPECMRSLFDLQIASVRHASFESDIENLTSHFIAAHHAPTDPSTAHDPLHHYLGYLRTAHSHLVPFFGDVSDRSLAEIYVELELDADAQPSERGTTSTSKRAPHFRSLEALVNQPQNQDAETARRWVLLGDPGAGKSTITRYLCYVAAGRADASRGDGLMPVFVSLARLSQDRAHPFDLAEGDVANTLGRSASAGLADALHGLARTTDRLVLILDGLDEVQPSRAAETHATILQLARDLRRVRIVVTTRRIGYDKQLEPTFERAAVQPLSASARAELLVKWLGKRDGKDLAARLSKIRHLDKLADNPLFLTLIAGLAREGVALPTTTVQLYERSVKLLLERGGASQNKGMKASATAYLLLPNVCLHLHREGRERWTKADLVRSLHQLRDLEHEVAGLLSSWPSPEAFLDELSTQTGLLGDLDGPHEPWRFIHRAIREYLAALRFAASGPMSYLSHVRALAADTPKLAYWSNTFAFVCGLADVDKRMPLLNQLRKASPELALLTLPNVEGLPPKDALAFLISTSGWDGDYLARLVAGWGAAAVPPTSIVDLVFELAKLGDNDLRKLAYLLYGLEGGGVDVDLDRFFEACQRSTVRPVVGRVTVPATQFLMGSSASQESYPDERPQREVSVESFALMDAPVTEAEWAAFLGSGQPDADTGRLPRVRVDWWEAWLFCRWLGGRLPTEAEWECACRAGSPYRYSLGDQLADLDRGAWYSANSGFQRRAVKVKAANALALHDMHGNVDEWCADWFGLYDPGDLQDPKGPSGGDKRVIRGGSFRDGAPSCRSAFRAALDPLARTDSVGFRVAWPVAAPTVTAD
ncbi:MAG: SUMF1/EgtB/PvdO family nonheme iron enzyme [Planctomycetota bacterium]